MNTKFGEGIPSIPPESEDYTNPFAPPERAVEEALDKLGQVESGNEPEDSTEEPHSEDQAA